MSKGIRISPKYGANPTMGVCFFCGEETGEIALLGRIGDGRKHEDIQAPMHMILNYRPCEKCREKFSKGVLLVEAETIEGGADNRLPIAKDTYPTGRFVLAAPNEHYPAGSHFLMSVEDFSQMLEESLQQ